VDFHVIKNAAALLHARPRLALRSRATRLRDHTTTHVRSRGRRKRWTWRRLCPSDLWLSAVAAPPRSLPCLERPLEYRRTVDSLSLHRHQRCREVVPPQNSALPRA
jgi:hypothetical protein